MLLTHDALQQRQADYPIEALLLKRWSPRAMSGESLHDADLKTLFEAARWAPSTYNEQEWRFCYAKRDTPQWNTFYSLLAEANQVWCAKASVLVVVCSHKVFMLNGQPNPVHTFDAGAAFENLVLQAASMDLVAHGMAGFDRGKTRALLNVPEDYDVEAMIAIGKPGDPRDLPEDYRKREVPTGRKPVEEIICEGAFAF